MSLNSDFHLALNLEKEAKENHFSKTLNLSRTSSRSSSPVTEATVKKFQRILAETQKNAIQAKKMIDEVKNAENNNSNGKQKKAVMIKGNTKLGKYNRKAKSHSGANDNNSNNQKLPIKRVR